jgi:hypothetical protein
VALGVLSDSRRQYNECVRPRANTVCESAPKIEIDLPAELRDEAQRIASEENWTLGQAVIFLVKRGVDSQRAAEEQLKRSYDRVMAGDADAAKHADARKDLTKAIFGPDAIATDQVL